MMKKLIFTAAVMCISALVSGQPLFERYKTVLTEPRSYDCFRTVDPIKIDGKLKEDSWLRAQPSEAFVDIRGEGYPAPCKETAVKMLWDDDYLYIAATLMEDNIVAKLTQRDTIIYHDNDFEVFLDPDGDGVHYFEIENNARGVIFDLMLDKPYRSGGSFFIPWNCEGLRLAVGYDGTLNKEKDTDRSWTVEMAIPFEALTWNFSDPRQYTTWRINFSRVQHLVEGQPEENWVWTPTGKVDMHMPDRWGFLNFVDAPAGSRTRGGHTIDLDAYRLLWAMFYAQLDNKSAKGNFLRTVDDFFLTDAELSSIGEDDRIDVEATSGSFLVKITLAGRKEYYAVVKNWMWMRLNPEWSDSQYREHFAKVHSCGISGILFEGYDRDVFRMCKEAGLEAHYWKWTMNRAECLETHPDWFAVNRKGESCFDHPAYVPDVILPVSLWKNYGIEQTQELPEYDFCYCDVCREKFKALTGKDPLELKFPMEDQSFPMEDQSWLNFRYDAITHVVKTIAARLKTEGKTLTAAVFPGPTMAKRMVRQDWGNWPLDAYFPMIYNGFYYEGPEWIGRSVAESVKAVGGRAHIYAGLMFPDIKGDDFEKALDAAYGNGASGVSFFDGPDYEYLERLKAYMDSHDMVPAN